MHLLKESLKTHAGYSMSEGGGVAERGTGRFDATLGDPGAISRVKNESEKTLRYYKFNDTFECLSLIGCAQTGTSNCIALLL